jgi:hypothetical protein
MHSATPAGCWIRDPADALPVSPRRVPGGARRGT